MSQTLNKHALRDVATCPNQPKTVDERRAKLRAYFDADAKRHRLSSRAVSEATGLTRRFIGRERKSMTPRKLVDTPRIGVDGRIVPPKGRRATELERLQARIVELETANSHLTTSLNDERNAAGEAVSAGEAAERKLQNYKRAKRRTRTAAEKASQADARTLRELAVKLAWHGWEHESATMASIDGLLVSHQTVVDLTPAERELFRELWTEREGEVMRHYEQEWGQRRFGRLARDEAEDFDLSRSQYADKDSDDRLLTSDADRWVHFRRDAWVLEQVERQPHPSSPAKAFARWLIAEIDAEDVPGDVPSLREDGGTLIPSRVLEVMRGGLVVVTRGERFWIVDLNTEER